MRARRFPCSASVSRRSRRAEISENSAPTKKALPPSSANGDQDPEPVVHRSTSSGADPAGGGGGVDGGDRDDVDSAAVHPHHAGLPPRRRRDRVGAGLLLEFVTFGQCDDVPLLGDATQQRDDETAEGVVVAVGRVIAGGGRELVDPQQTRADPAVVGAGDVGLFVVVLVGDVADDLLDEVLGGDDACGAAVLVDDHRHLQTVAADPGHEGVTVETVGDHGDGPGDVPHRRRPSLRDGERERCLMWTNPRMLSRSPSTTTGKRLKPVCEAARIRSRTSAVSSSASTVDRGVISSSAVRSPKRSDRPTRMAVLWSSDPSRAEFRTSEPSSSGDRAERSSSAGSMPSRRTTQLAVPLVPRIAQEKIAENPTIGPAVARAVGSGRAIAAFFGMSSPSTIDSEVATTSARMIESTSTSSSPAPAPPGPVRTAAPAPARRCIP